MKLHEFQVGDFGPGLVSQPDSITGGWRRVGGVAIAAPQAAGGQEHCPRLQATDRRLANRDRLHPPTAAVADQKAPH